MYRMTTKEAAEKWANNFLQSEEGIEFTKQQQKEFVEYFISGKTPEDANSDLYEDLVTVCKLSVDTVLERFSDILTEEQKEMLKTYKDVRRNK